jgi:hypothetical protein
MIGNTPTQVQLLNEVSDDLRENSAPERRHKTVKAEAILPPRAGDLRPQQQAFDRFSDVDNYKRPHSAYAGDPRADRYDLSLRAIP